MKSQLLKNFSSLGSRSLSLFQSKFVTTFSAAVLPDEFDKKISDNPDDLKAFKTHPGKSNVKRVAIADVLEENINRLVGGK